jgi:hypothetical protein
MGTYVVTSQKYSVKTKNLIWRHPTYDLGFILKTTEARTSNCKIFLRYWICIHLPDELTTCMTDTWA